MGSCWWKIEGFSSYVHGMNYKCPFSSYLLGEQLSYICEDNNVDFTAESGRMQQSH